MADPSKHYYHGDDCDFCQSMVIDWGNTVDVVTGGELDDELFFLGPTLADVLLAEHVCPFAKRIIRLMAQNAPKAGLDWNRLRDFSADLRLVSHGKDQLEYTALWDRSTCMQNDSDEETSITRGARFEASSVYLTKEGSDTYMVPSHLEYMASQRRNREFLSIRLEYWLWASEGDPAASVITARPINTSPISAQTFKLIRSWLLECEESHEACSKRQRVSSDSCRVSSVGHPEDIDFSESALHTSKPGFVPLRLLYVIQQPRSQHRGYRVSLRSNVSNQCPEYLALSYCWGGDQPHKTTRNTLNSSGQRTLRWQRLPRTIQDAVRVTVSLGFQWLWVDSLCIVQDDEVEMAQQIALMPKIYSNASVTIIASKATRAADGFLADVKLEKNGSVSLKLPFFANISSTERARGVVYAYHEDNMPPFNFREVQAVDERGWTFQERYLSSRILEFRTTEVRLTCVSWQLAPSGGLPDDATVVTNEPAKTTAWVFRNESATKPAWVFGDESANDPAWWPWQDLDDIFSPAESGHDSAEQFYSMVEKYTQRKLSDPRDRILAISGIAEVFQGKYADDYLVGIWRRSLPFGLLWHADRKVKARRPTETEYQAPSWSWAACNTEVSFRYIMDRLNPAAKPTISTLESHIDLVEESAPCGAARFGSSIIGMGKLVDALWYGRQDMYSRAREDLFEPPSETMIHGASLGYMYYIGIEGDAIENEHEMVGYEEVRRDLDIGMIRMIQGQQLLKVKLLELLRVPIDEDALTDAHGDILSIGLVLRPVEDSSPEEDGNVKTTPRQPDSVPRYSRLGLYRLRNPAQGYLFDGERGWNRWTSDSKEDAARTAKRFMETFREERFEIV